MLLIITASDDDASKVYVKKKIEKFEKEGIKAININCYRNELWSYDGKITIEDATDLNDVIGFTIDNANLDPNVNGILLQLPLDESIKENTDNLIDMISPYKDVDCLTTYNQGKIALGDNSFLPCTTQAVLDMIKENTDDIKNEKVIIVGRSNLVTKPLIIALTNLGYSISTFNSNHSSKYDDKIEIQTLKYCESESLYEKVHFVTGIGVANEFFFYKQPGQDNHKLYIYDIGMNRDENGKLCGDVYYMTECEFQTPVPGGVGPKTVENVVKNYKKLIEVNK